MLITIVPKTLLRAIFTHRLQQPFQGIVNIDI
jgi:hypothetical protein